jgi:DNA-binding winged helix-turn-helix (wHTH) protein
MRQNKIFTRDEILNRIWTDSISVSHRTVDVHVSNLRRKLADMGVTIETIIGTGYRIAVCNPGDPDVSELCAHGAAANDLKRMSKADLLS